MSDDDKQEVQLPQGAPFVHPGVPEGAVDQAAIFNAAKQARRSANALPKTTTPVAGGPTPPIPHLAGAPQAAGMTMAQHAVAERGGPVQAGPPMPQQPQGFVEPATAAPAVMGANQAPPSPAQLGILPTDELPKEATQDPNFMQGTGSMFAASQPALAMKYGVIRRGQHIPPQQLLGQQTQQTKLRPETVRDLEELQSLQARQEKGAAPPQPQGPSAMGEAAGNVGTPALTDADKEELKTAVQNLDEFDFDRWRQSMMKDVLNNEEQRRIIEARLEPMDVGDMVTQGFAVQRVPIIPGKFWVEFKTMEGEVDLALKRIIMEDSQSVEVSDRYFLDKFGLMSVAAVLHKVNDKPFGDYMDEHGNFDDDKFKAKFRRVVKLPMPMLASLGANALWFDIRVRKLFVAEELGNG